MYASDPHRYLDNIHLHPEEEKYQKIKLQNKVFQVRCSHRLSWGHWAWGRHLAVGIVASGFVCGHFTFVEIRCQYAVQPNLLGEMFLPQLPKC